MRLCASIIFAAVVVLSMACSSRSDSLKQEAESGKVILRISTDSEGNVYPDGSILDINLRADGTFEYDEWPEQPPANYVAGNVVTTRKQAHLSPEDVKELMSIAEQPDFLGAAEAYNYPGPGIPTDVLSRTVVTYTHGGKMKQVLLDNYSPESPNAAYPASLKKLLRRVHELKVKATGKNNPFTY